MVTAMLRGSLPPFWRSQRARRPGRCRSCAGLGSFRCPLTLLSLAFAVVKSHLQNQAFTSESIRACSPSFAWAGVLPVQIDRNTHLPP